MKYVHIDSVEPGQYLGKTIFSSSGAILLAEGVQLTPYMISTLNRIGVTMLFIKDPALADVEIVDVVSEETKRHVMQRMGEAFAAIKSGKEFSSKAIGMSIDSLMDDVMKHKDVLLQLSDIRTKDNEMYVHAMNVCIISVMIGFNLGLHIARLKELAIGALLHDIGKVEQAADDSSEDVKKHHTWRGFEVLKNKREYSLLIAHAAFQHHEQPDGQGLPRKLPGDQIHLYAKIVSVANTYDNLLFDLSQGRRLLPHEATERMMAMSGTVLDRDMLIEFLKVVSIYPNGTSVRLSTREMGIVVGQHRGLPGRPVVRLAKQEDYGDLEVKEIDLAQRTTVFIDKVM